MELVLDDVAVVFRRGGVETRAVRGVSLQVRRAETLAVVGESGSGKTTIGKVVAGLQAPTSGALIWRDLDGAPCHGTRRVQMVFQHPVQSLDPVWRIRRVVQEPLRRAGVSRGEAEARVVNLIEQVGLDAAVLDRYPSEVSGGQAQRIAIARALIADPELVVLDEPTASLDQTVRSRILALLAELQVRTGVGYLMITHDISGVRRLGTRVAVVRRGRVVETGPACRVLEGARHPYTRALISAVPVPDPRVPWSAPAANGAPPCPVPASPCGAHGPGLHRVGPDHLVACTAAEPEREH